MGLFPEPLNLSEFDGHTRKELFAKIESLRQRLSNALGILDAETQIEAEANLFEIKKQLAAALAACKLKDEALSKIEYLEADNGSILSAGGCSSIATEALAIQPDDAALKVWIGEPVAIMGSHGHPKHISYIPGIQEEKLYGPWIPLYAPKGMK